MTHFLEPNRIPIFQIGDCLLLTIQVDLEDRMIMTLKDDLAERIAKTHAKGVLIDISALDVVDSFIGRMLANISAIARDSGCGDGDRRHAPGGRDNPGRTRHVAPGRPDGARRRSRHGADPDGIPARRPSASMRSEEGRPEQGGLKRDGEIIPPKPFRSAPAPMSAGSAGRWPPPWRSSARRGSRPRGW